MTTNSHGQMHALFGAALTPNTTVPLSSLIWALLLLVVREPRTLVAVGGTNPTNEKFANPEPPVATTLGALLMPNVAFRCTNARIAGVPSVTHQPMRLL